MDFADIPQDVLQTLIFPLFSLKEVGRLALSNKFWYQESWSNVIHLDLSYDSDLGVDGVRFLSFRPALMNVKSIKVGGDGWKSDKNEGIARHVGNLITSCGASLRTIKLDGGQIDRMLPEKFLIKHGSQLQCLSLNRHSGGDTPIKFLELVIRCCCNLESFSVCTPSKVDIVPSLVESMTNLHKLTLRNESNDPLSPQLSELRNLTLLRTSTLPEFLSTWDASTASVVDLAQVDADIEAFKQQLPPKLNLSNVKQKDASLFFATKNIKILRHLIENHGVRMTAGGLSWKMRL
eukprot:TRINITY_DN7560_c0_g1_i1.p1 TRINITY_DN7560_c0_g1~~TRINITY_DN7560_c0_g1_i1.p1  ORF type:complete len:292 (-),score=20.91 TRINITY_DN7560_c0_g1_i1:178-1053(-)